MERIENNDKFDKMKKDLKQYSIFTELDVIKETEKAVLAEVDFLNTKCMKMLSIKRWIPKSYLYFYEYENGFKTYLVNREFVRYA